MRFSKTPDSFTKKEDILNGTCKYSHKSTLLFFVVVLKEKRVKTKSGESSVRVCELSILLLGTNMNFVVLNQPEKD